MKTGHSCGGCVRAASGTVPRIEEIVIQSSQYTVFENRLDKPCPLELDGGDLCNGSTSSVGCVHRIAWATAHSAALDEGPCAAFRCFRASHLPPPPPDTGLAQISPLSHPFAPPPRSSAACVWRVRRRIQPWQMGGGVPTPTSSERTRCLLPSSLCAGAARQLVNRHPLSNPA